MERYKSHLVALVKGKINLLAADDIRSEQGTVLLISGSPITQEVYDRLSNLALSAPLDSSLAIENPMSAATIDKKIYELIKQDPFISPINDELGNSEIFQQCCACLDQYPYLREIVTVLEIEHPQLFQQSLLSAYFAYICGMVNEFSQQEIEHAFMAGLFHDIGLLFIKRATRHKKGALTSKEWHEMQLHPIIAYKLFKAIDGFPRPVARAILQHHEKADGSSYPMATESDKLTNLGELISILDDVIAIYHKQFKPAKRSLSNLTPILQMNSNGYQQQTLSCVIQVIKRSPPSSIGSAEYKVIKDLIDYTHQQQLYANALADAIKQANEAIGFEHYIKKLELLQDATMNILVVISSSGLQDILKDVWLEQLSEPDHQSLYNEIEHTHLMLEEIIYQLRSYQKKANTFVSKNKDKQERDEIVSHINRTLGIFAETPIPHASKALENYWQKHQ